MLPALALLIVSSLVVTNFGAGPAPQPPAPLPMATTEAPTGWSRSQRGALTLLQPPERDSRLVILQLPVAQAAGAEQAVARFWRELGRPAPALQGGDPPAG